MNTSYINTMTLTPSIKRQNRFTAYNLSIHSKEGTPVFKFTFIERLWYLRQFGMGCMSFSVLQPNMAYFDMQDTGFIAYKKKWGSCFVLSDPICTPQNRTKLLSSFLKVHPNATFIQVSEDMAKLLNQEFGYFSTQLGIETTIDLTAWTLKGKKKQVLRTAVNQAAKKGIVIKENPKEYRENEITSTWLKTRRVKNKEIRFLIRPLKMNYEYGTRKFYAYHEDRLIGFIHFDPIYNNNQIVGYVPNISRFNQDFSQGIFYALVIHAMETFKSEGIQEINLGLSPLVLDDATQSFESGIFKKFLKTTFQYGNSFYNFKGIQFTKSRFRGNQHKVYNAHKGRLPLFKFMKVFKLSNVI